MPQPQSSTPPGAKAERPPRFAIHPDLGTRTIVLVGLMGVGKTTVGRSLAKTLNLPFRDADEEIERAAGRTVSDIFAERGEAEFRDGERRVIARLLTQEAVHVLALGGGAFVHADTRTLARTRALSVWLKVDLELLAKRVSRRDTRPLLIGKDPLQVLRSQAVERYPAYAEAQVTVEAGQGSSAATVSAVLRALSAELEASSRPVDGP